MILLTIAAFAEEYPFEKAEDITYEWLATGYDDTGGTSHVACFKEIFSKVKIKALLEFGLGPSTKYFLDSCKRVISVEVITNGYGPNRLQKFLKFYKDYSNWVPIAYFSDFHGDMTWAPYKFLGSDHVYKACSYQCVTGLHYKDVDEHYLKELNEFITNLSKYNKIDAALVHPILYLRGDLVQLLFDKVPIIVAHDTCTRVSGTINGYGYVRVKTPDNYEEIYLPLVQEQVKIPGTTVWIMKKPEYNELIQSLKKLI